ncbi:unnamed protein product, partial [Rangifer tarandus platyrhynchus]
MHPSVTCGPIYQILTQSQLGPNTTLREDKTQSSWTEPVSTLVTQLLGGLRVSGDNMSQAEVTGVSGVTATSRAWTLATSTARKRAGGATSREL